MKYLSECDAIDNQVGYLYIIETPYTNSYNESLYYIGSKKTTKFIDYNYLGSSSEESMTQDPNSTMHIIMRYSPDEGESIKDCYIRLLIDEGNLITEHWFISGKYNKTTNTGRVLNKHNNTSEIYLSSGTKGRRIINNGITELFIYPEELSYYEGLGFKLGRRSESLNWTNEETIEKIKLSRTINHSWNYDPKWLNTEDSIRKRVATNKANGFYDFDEASKRSRKAVNTKRESGYYDSDTCIDNALRMQSISALPENREKAKATLIKKQGSVNGHMQTKDTRDKVMKVYKWDTPEGTKLSRYIHSTKRDHPEWMLVGEANDDEINTYGIYTKTKVNKHYRFKDNDGNEYIYAHLNAVLKKHPDWILLGEV